MTVFSSFPEGQIEALANLLGECGSGTDISRVLRDRSLANDSVESAKWWPYGGGLAIQRLHHCANRVIDFIRLFLIPARFVDASDELDGHSQHVNTILAFSGFEYGQDGKMRPVEVARTLDEAEKRVRFIQMKLRLRLIHPEVLKYCNHKLPHDNYFHSFFEATKGLAHRISEKSGIPADGSDLINQLFFIKRPIPTINTLQTKPEKSEHKGFVALLKGCLMAVRNPLSHEPSVLWQSEGAAADYRSLTFLQVRKLDDSVSTEIGGPVT